MDRYDRLALNLPRQRKVRVRLMRSRAEDCDFIIETLRLKGNEAKMKARKLMEESCAPQKK